MTAPCWWTHRSTRYLGVAHFRSCFNLSLLNSAGYFLSFPRVSIAKSKIAQIETEESIRNSITHHCLYSSEPQAYLTHENWKWGNEMFWALTSWKNPQHNWTVLEWVSKLLLKIKVCGHLCSWPLPSRRVESGHFKTEIMLKINCWQKHKALLRRNYRHFRG